MPSISLIWGAGTSSANDCCVTFSPDRARLRFIRRTRQLALRSTRCGRPCGQNLDEDDASNYDEDHMLEIIDAYKGPGIFLSASDNYRHSRKWAQAGYHAGRPDTSSRRSQ
jgi:hypothetical protein